MPSLAQARAHWWNRQFPGGKGSLAATLGASGWLRTLGGADVYLAARARRPGMKRAELDAAVASGELRVLPAARGCIYLVPAAIVPDLLALNHDEWHRTAAKDLAKIKKSVKDLEPVARAVLGALAKGPLTTDALRKAIDVPSFGDAGKKIGISSPLPLALRSLEVQGLVERTLDGGRLDTATYLWRKPAAKLRAPSKDPWLAVVDAFLGFAGPAALSDIAAWSGRAQRDARDAIIALGVRTIDVEDVGEAYLRAGDELDDRPPRGVALLAFEDNYLVNHATLAVVSDPRHHQIPINLWGGGDKPSPIREASHVLTRTIVIDGLVAGFWEVDPRTHGGVWTTFDPPGARADEIDAAVQDTARFLLDELGHAKAYTLDTMDHVQDRADRIAKMKPGRVAPAKKPKLVAKVAARAASAKKPAKSSARRA